MVKRAAKNGPRGESEGRWDSLDPAEILTGWRDAVFLSAAVILQAPLRLAGIKPAKPKKGELAEAVRGYPVIGFGMGLAAALVYAIAHGLNLPPVLAAILAVATLACLNGAASENGLARFADALIVAENKTAQLARMKEDSFGAYGMIVLVATLGLRIGALTVIAEPLAVTAALVAAQGASWTAGPAMMHYLPAAQRSGFAYLDGRPRRDQTYLTLALGAAMALLFLGPVTGVIALAVGALGAFKFAWLAKRNLGGTTGEVLGAGQQGAEIGMLLAIIALA